MNKNRAAVDSQAVQLVKMRQIELYERSRQEGGAYDPFDWQTPGETIPGRFVTLARRYPDRQAAYDTASLFTYRQLDEASNRLANALLSRRGPSNEIVALMITAGTGAVIAALGTLKAGKAYVGFDDVFTDERSASILADAECSIIVCDEFHAELAEKLAKGKLDIIHLDDSLRYSADSPQVYFTHDDLAVLTYSSGTTGQPKGIVQTHYTALAHAVGFAELECFGANDRVSTFGSLASGSNFLKMFSALCSGACVATFNIRRFGIDDLFDWMDETGVTATGARAIVRQMYALAGERQLPKVRTITLGGDTIYRRDIVACRRLFPNALASVGLGMTEASRVTEWLVDATMPLDEEVVPTGYPVPNVRIVILDENGDEAEPGELGEIAVLSNFLAKGYWKQPELTASRFLQFPRYAPMPLYRTGDMGRIGPDGMLSHMGRKDFLVKIRGYFVPTNEVEGLLLSQPGITEAAVVKYKQGADRGTLVGYIVVDNEFIFSADELQSMLAERLPAYMVPQRIIFMDTLPHNPRGKVDQSKLPAPGSARPYLTVPFVAPETPLEKRVTELWSELLGIDPIGMHDKFLALGGDSLQAMRLVNRVNAALDIDLPAATLLSAATVADMVSILRDHLFGSLDAQT